MEESLKYLIVIVGPTAVGKTALTIKLATELNTDIISADSRQVYKEMNIGTAKPSLEELSKVRHHFINSHSVFEEFNAGRFETEALALLENIFQVKNSAILVGGSGLYIDALCNGIDAMPVVNLKIRAELNTRFQREGLEMLLEELRSSDPAYYDVVDKNNPQRIIRALEIIYSTGKPYSGFRERRQIGRPFKIIKIGLQMDRGELYHRIDTRMDSMIDAGLFEEAKALFPLKHLNALQTVGYSEIFQFLEGAYSEDEAIRLLKRNSRRYAKRQMTWFNKDSSIAWFSPDEYVRVLEFVKGSLEL